MSESQPQVEPRTTGENADREPYPKIIIVCIIIAGIFFAIVLAALLLEFIENANDTTPKPPDLLIPPTASVAQKRTPRTGLHPKLPEMVSAVNTMNPAPKV